MIDQETKRIIGEILKDQSQTKDMILYDLLIEGEIKAEENAEKQKNEIKEEKQNQSTIETKPVFIKCCKRDDCKFNRLGFCTSNEVNSQILRCDINTNYIGFEKRG